MGKNLFEKIISAHHVEGECVPGQEISIRVDHTLTQDALGALVYLELESIGIDKVRTELSVSYTDHLMLQYGEGNADVHRYLETVADRYGVIYSRPGNGICHQTHLERFSRPGKTLIGSDSHTVTCGAAGMLAIGAGGLDVAMAMAGRPYHLTYPRVVKVELIGKLPDWSAAKDIILEVLRRLTSKGNVATVLEYAGPGLETLTVPQRATIANMGAETGTTASLFPSDEQTLRFFRAQGREADWSPLAADTDAQYDTRLTIDLSALEPLAACPHSPDKVTPVRALTGKRVTQVLIGSCTNSSYEDLYRAACILRGRKIAPHVSLGIAPGSRQVLEMLAENGALSWLVQAGARILESACGFCVGHGQTPELEGVSVRTSNRNFKGRCGTPNAQVYLASPEVAAVTAITGCLTDPRDAGIPYPVFDTPGQMWVDDSMFLFPTGTKEIYRSRLIGKPPANTPMPQALNGEVAIKVGDYINTDDIAPAGLAMAYRANIEKSCDFSFTGIDPHFPTTCRTISAAGRSPVIVGGESYGQGSSREHASLCPMTLGVRFILAKSFERIHHGNLINFGILPLVFHAPEDYDTIENGDFLQIEDCRTQVLQDMVEVINVTKGLRYRMINSANARQRTVVLSGGELNMI